MEKQKVSQAAECFFFLEEDVTVRMDIIDIGYVGFHHKHEELVIYRSSLAREVRARGAPCVSKCTHPRKFNNHETVHRPPVRPQHRHTKV